MILFFYYKSNINNNNNKKKIMIITIIKLEALTATVFLMNQKDQKLQI